MNKKELDQFITQWRRLRTYDWHYTHWVIDDESSLSIEEKITMDRLLKDGYLTTKKINKRIILCLFPLNLQ